MAIGTNVVIRSLYNYRFMNNTIFLIESAGYSSQLLSYYIEKETPGEVIQFFHEDEIFSYNKLEPAIMIFCQNDGKLSREYFKRLKNNFKTPINLINVQGNFIEVLSYKEDQKGLKITASLVPSNIYLSTMEICQKILATETVNYN